MQEIVKIYLDNDMDLILAHKRTVKISELCGLSVPSQTTFATAVSEIARSAISLGKNSYLVLSINALRAGKKEISASIYDSVDLIKQNNEAISYARKLMGDIRSKEINGMYEIQLSQHIPFSGTITETKIESFKTYFKNEPPLSPYDEIRKKNILLIDLAEKLRESENQYRLLTDTLPLMMFAINHRYEVTYYNKWLKDFFAIPETKMTIIPWKLWMHAKDYKIVISEWEKAQSQKTTLRLQCRLKFKNREEYLWHLVTIVPVKNELSASVSWIGFFVDIHAQKIVEETLKDNKELKEVQSQLKEHQLILEQKIQELNISNSDLEQFAYIASHDLQEPLRKIITFSSIIKDSQTFNHENTRYFDKIISATRQMSNLIKGVLNYSSVTGPKDRFEEIDLNEIIELVKSDYELLIVEKSAVINAVKLPVIRGVRLQLCQLFSNLLSNALKFSTEPPRIEMTFIQVEGDEFTMGLNSSKSYVKIMFSDNGIGFDQIYKDRIFNIFQRLNNKSSYEGTGIGLALCKKIMDNHEGQIMADSELNKGTEFSMYFPV